MRIVRTTPSVYVHPADVAAMEGMSAGLLGKALETVLPGTILEVGAEGMLVQTGKGMLRVLEIQMPSARRMRVAEWANGHELKCGTVLGDSF